MSRKKILIVTHGFYPEQSPRSFRATELAKEFCRQGHQVTVMAPFRDGTDALANNYGFVYRSLGVLSWRIFNFRGFGIFGRLYNKASNRLFTLLFEYPKMELFFKVKNALSNEMENYDLLISIAVPYPIHWGVAAVWQKSESKIAQKWVADCGDPYCLQENDTFRPPFYFRWIEKWFMRKTDYITVPSINSINGYFQEFHSKIRVIPQGFRFEDVEKRETINDGIIRFGYGGAFIPGRRDPTEFLAYLTSLPREVRFEFHIFTTTPQFVEPYIHSNKKIFVHKPIDRLNLLKEFSTYNFVVNFSNKGSAQKPSKLIDYAIIDKPILNIDTGKLNPQTIESFFRGDYSFALKVKDADSYRIENVTQSFLKLK